ncbi:hypothetical protein AD951_01770 [Acetobacter malorum]|uniref:Uncharacterized protein n=1 Tax=Acetobacter malorum TaxID=178901 RepID=A0A149UTH3_9PROT|nr:hypothetical protein AD951_01770 [Acetobacter malorum]
MALHRSLGVAILECVLLRLANRLTLTATGTSERTAANNAALFYGLIRPDSMLQSVTETEMLNRSKW